MAVCVAQWCGPGAEREPGCRMGEVAPPLPLVYKRFICSVPDCNATYNKNWKLLAHLCKHTGECYFADCGQQFRKHNQLKLHQYIHTNQHPFKCSHEGCDKSFALPSKLKRHEKIHAGYPCQKDSTCPFVGNTWSEYLKHAAAVHSDVTCNVCNRTFKSKSNLKDHKKIHREERIVYRCPREDCDRTYTTKFNLKSHILSFHENLRSFVCEHEGCGKTFAMKQSLARHVNTHDPVRKKMVMPPPPTRSLASRLSGYKPKKSSKKKKSSSKTPASESSEKPLVGQPDTLLVLETLNLK
ncbi:transcription factor IIIA isoform X3 [Ranitomeya imitator]|uniref:transcription factor IIIA isoform X3 n=1 Tax=Ranitomeya imitator TaxID=111125 RepID=UPI0037E843F7